MSNKKPPLTLDQRVLEFIRCHNLLQSGQKVLVAVSGGPDSVCLLHVLYQLRTELNITLHIAHLNHQLRGEEAENEARYVSELAQKLGLPAVIENRDVAGYQAEHHLSLEEAAREVRYSFLAQTAAAIGADRVAVGHTLNDQVETILLHIIRGAGTRGLRGLQPVHTLQFSGQPLTVVRPLLEIKREETSNHCSELHLTPCLDSSNLSPSMLRNRVRQELLPLLQSYNPGIYESLLRISRIAEDEQAFMDFESEKLWNDLIAEKNDTLIFEKSRFKNLAPAAQRHLLRKAIEKQLGTLKDIETRHIAEILAALDKPEGKKIILPQGLIFSIEYDRYLLGRHPESLTPFPEIKGDYELKVPGRTAIPGWCIDISIKSPSSIIEGEDTLEGWNNDGFTACLDQDRVGDIIRVRARQEGDRFQPLGLEQTKKVGRFMLDARVPQSWRDRIPILYTPQQIIWVAGWRIDDRVKVTDNTRRVLYLKMVRPNLP